MTRTRIVQLSHQFHPRQVRRHAYAGRDGLEVTIEICAACGMSRQYAEWSGNPCMWRDDPREISPLEARTYYAGAGAAGALPVRKEPGDET